MPPAIPCLPRHALARSAQTENNRGSSKFLVSYCTSFLTLFFFGYFFFFPAQSVCGVKTLNFVGSKEVVYERSDWLLAKLQDYVKNDTLALISYGSQGHGQG
jgi:hypothetical protein